MIDWFVDWHVGGLVIGILTFIIIGIFHPIVIKSEYYFGVKCWWVFLVVGIGGIIATILVDDLFVSSLLGVFSFSSLWSILEIFEQRERVRKGWFPSNPKKNATNTCSKDKLNK